MRYIINHNAGGEESLTLNYVSESPEVERILRFMQAETPKLTGRAEDHTVVVSPDDILYAESVDEKTFVYTDKEAVKVDLSLNALVGFLADDYFFRCSKSMIVNVRKVSRLKSLSSNRIDCMLENGEHIMISRTYASDFRKLLKGEK